MLPMSRRHGKHWKDAGRNLRVSETSLRANMLLWTRSFGTFAISRPSWKLANFVRFVDGWVS